MADDVKKPIEDKAAALQLSALQAIDWKGIWMIPAGAAALVMVIFFVLFKDDRPGSQPKEEVAASGEPEQTPEAG